MKIISWNIRCGGGRQTGGIQHELFAADPDVIVLGEYMPRSSDGLIAALHQGGWVHCVLSSPPSRRGGVAVLSKSPFEQRQIPLRMEDSQYRYLSVAMSDQDIELRAVYAPLHNDPYVEFWEGLLEDLESDADRSTVLVGDLNSGMPRIDTPAATLFCSQYFGQLPGRGFIDLWRRMNGQTTQACTWQGRVNPFRLDHAFGTASAATRLLECSYDHSVRERGLSDHSMLTVVLETP